MGEPNVIAILCPRPEKVAEFRQAVAAVVSEVHAKEDFTLRYLVTEDTDSATPRFIFIESYKTKAAVVEHGKTSHFKTFFKTLTKSDILAKPAEIIRTVDVAGFDKDRKVVSKL